MADSDERSDSGQKTGDVIVPGTQVKEFTETLRKYADSFEKAYNACQEAKREMEAMRVQHRKELNDCKKMWSSKCAVVEAKLSTAEQNLHTFKSRIAVHEEAMKQNSSLQ